MHLSCIYYAYYLNKNLLKQNLPIDPLMIRELVKTSQEYNDNWEKEITKHGVEFVDDESLIYFIGKRYQ